MLFDDDRQAARAERVSVVAPPRAGSAGARDPSAMRSLHAELAVVPDYRRRAQGRKHTVACVLVVHMLATPANMKDCVGGGTVRAGAVAGGARGHRRLAQPEDRAA